MIDLKLIRDDPGVVREAMYKRGDERAAALVDAVVESDEERRTLIREAELLKAERNTVSRAIGEAKKQGLDATPQIEAMRTVANRIRELDGQTHVVEDEIRTHLLQIPNLPHPEVPPGEEGAGPVISTWGEPRQEAVPPHWELGKTHGYTGLGGTGFPGGFTPSLDFERGAKIAGAGFPLLVGGGARLSRALIQFMLDLHVSEHGYLEVTPPFLVSRKSMTSTGHLPKFEDDAYRTVPDDLFLIPTAEVPVTNLHAGEILAHDDLPLAYVAQTPCFRREAGAAGRDTRGLLRVHQFDKVEVVRVCRAEDSDSELKLIIRHAERVLELLELPYRRVLLPLRDLGFANAITYDLEVWAPGIEDWLEISSCSSYSDYQARRCGIRYRPDPGGKLQFAHTLNGSALAIPRLIVALLENGYQGEAGIALPEVLHPYLGFDRLEPVS